MNVKSYVISLERAHERKAQALAEQEQLGLPYAFVSAVDALGCDNDVSNSGYTEELGRELRNIHQTRGLARTEQACALSHLKTYRQIIADGVDIAVVCEDDAVFRCDRDALMDAIRALPSGWDVFYLYHRGNLQWQGRSRVSFLSVPGGAVAYVITQSAAAKLLELSKPLRLASDALLGRAVFIGLLKGYGAFPLMAAHQDAGQSQLRGPARRGIITAIKGWLLSRSMLARKLSFLFTKSNSYFCRFW